MPANNATPINVQQVGEALPAPIGGAIVAGTYYLTAVNIYTGLGGTSGPTGEVVQETLSFGVGIIQDISAIGADAGVGAATGYSANYTTTGSSITVSYTCPVAAPATATYSAIGSTFHLFVGTTENIYTFQM